MKAFGLDSSVVEFCLVCDKQIYTFVMQMFTHENKHLGFLGKPGKKKVKIRAMANTVTRKMGILIFLNDVIFIALPIKLSYYNKHTGVKTVGLV